MTAELTNYIKDIWDSMKTQLDITPHVTSQNDGFTQNEKIFNHSEMKSLFRSSPSLLNKINSWHYTFLYNPGEKKLMTIESEVSSIDKSNNQLQISKKHMQTFFRYYKCADQMFENAKKLEQRDKMSMSFGSKFMQHLISDSCRGICDWNVVHKKFRNFSEINIQQNVPFCMKTKAEIRKDLRLCGAKKNECFLSNERYFNSGDINFMYGSSLCTINKNKAQPLLKHKMIFTSTISNTTMLKEVLEIYKENMINYHKGKTSMDQKFEKSMKPNQTHNISLSVDNVNTQQLPPVNYVSDTLSMPAKTIINNLPLFMESKNQLINCVVLNMRQNIEQHMILDQTPFVLFKSFVGNIIMK